MLANEVLSWPQRTSLSCKTHMLKMHLCAAASIELGIVALKNMQVNHLWGVTKNAWGFLRKKSMS
jgi:hypothetical protein